MARGGTALGACAKLLRANAARGGLSHVGAAEHHCPRWQTETASPSFVQRRHGWYWDVDANRKNRDKPAMTSPHFAHVFLAGQIPVVLLDTVRGVGRKGQIVSVKRGYARHHLVPKGLAVLGTWENIDMYADPTFVDDPTMQGRVGRERQRLPFDWVGELRLRFQCWAMEDQLDTLAEPLTVWEVLEELSQAYELDLLPGNIDVPEGGYTKVGVYEVDVRVPFRDPERAVGRYSILVEIVSEQSLLEERRRDAMAKAAKESARFTLLQRASSQAEPDALAASLEQDEPDDNDEQP